MSIQFRFIYTNSKKYKNCIDFDRIRLYPTFEKYFFKEKTHHCEELEKNRKMVLEDDMYYYLAGRLRQLQITQAELAAQLGLTPASLSHRMTGRVPWRVNEMYQVLKLIRAPESELSLYFPEV